MVAFAFGWPRALATVGALPTGAAVHVSLGPDYLVIVFAGGIQIWTGGQHRVKIGELVRNPTSMQEEGAHTRAYWCPGRKCLAVLVRMQAWVGRGLPRLGAGACTTPARNAV